MKEKSGGGGGGGRERERERRPDQKKLLIGRGKMADFAEKLGSIFFSKF